MASGLSALKVARVDGLRRWWWVPMVGDSTIKFDVVGEMMMSRGLMAGSREDDFGGFAMKILRGSQRLDLR